MSIIQTVPALAEQVYQAILGEIFSGELAPGTHLKQDQLAQRLGVSRQPVQQALALLKADGLVEDVGKKGMQVSHLDIESMHHHYEIRGTLDALAAHSSATRIATDGKLREAFAARVRDILSSGKKAVVKGDVLEMVRHDEAFHQLFYETSGNPLIIQTVEPHWRFLRRVMGDVLRGAEPPRDIWEQHEGIVAAVLKGDAVGAGQLMREHAARAARLLAENAGNSGADAS